MACDGAFRPKKLIKDKSCVCTEKWEIKFQNGANRFFWDSRFVLHLIKGGDVKMLLDGKKTHPSRSIYLIAFMISTLRTVECLANSVVRFRYIIWSYWPEGFWNLKFMLELSSPLAHPTTTLRENATRAATLAMVELQWIIPLDINVSLFTGSSPETSLRC